MSTYTFPNPKNMNANMNIRSALLLIVILFSFASCSRSTGQNAENNLDMSTNTTEGIEIATLGAGCFWCVEAQFKMLEGVIDVVSGYSGGQIKNPSYKEVCTGRTGHAEVCQITFDPKVISYGEVLQAFWQAHDPTQLNRQGNDIGTQYRSAIFYHSEEQKKIAEEQISKLNAENVFGSPVVTEVTAYSVFYKAEDYHQDYFELNGNEPYCSMVVRPKVEKFKKVFKDRLKNKP